MTKDEFEEFVDVAENVSPSYAVCQWPERFKEILEKAKALRELNDSIDRHYANEP
jgi:hypothetical protein